MPSERFSDGIFCCRKHTVGNICEQNQKQRIIYCQRLRRQSNIAFFPHQYPP